MKRSRGRRSRRRGNSSGFRNVENTPVSALRTTGLGSASSGSSFQILWSALPAATGNTCRISSLEIEIVADASSAAVFIALNDFAGVAKTNTRTLLVGTVPSRYKVKMPKSTDFGVPLNAAIALEITTVGTLAATFSYIVNYAVRDS